MTSREAFEAWISAQHALSLLPPESAMYKRLRAAYRAGAEAMREKAAKVCDELRGPIEIYNRGYPAMLEAETKIRALQVDA